MDLRMFFKVGILPITVVFVGLLSVIDEIRDFQMITSGIHLVIPMHIETIAMLER
jgi:hypothetical protein